MKTYTSLTKTQYGLYVECVNHPGEPCYNIPCFYILDGSLDEERLRKAVEMAVAAHPTLFTRIELTDEGDPVQTVDDTETFSLQVEHIDDIEDVKKTMVQPFNIVGDRLFRIRLLRDKEHFYYFQDIHHTIFDGGSLGIMLADIEKAYNGEPLEPEQITLTQLAVAEEEQRKTDAFEEDKKWYANNFDCSDCYSPLLSDQLEQSKQPSAETKLTRTLNVVIDSVDAFCKSNGIFRSSFFTAAYAYLLAKYNNDQQVLFNTVHNGRADKRSNRTVGMLVKTVPVYAKFDGDTRVLDFIKAGEEQMKGCRQHISYNYSDAINDLGLQPATLFVWHGNTLDNNPFCGKPMKFELLCNNSREVSLYLKAFIKDGRFEVEAEYNSNEYSEALIDQFMESYEAVIEGFLSQERLCDINMTTASQMSLLDSFNDTDRPYDETQTVVSLFRRQAKATPDAEAVVFKDHRYTYAEVDEISDRIAGYILSKGLNVGDAVSVIIPRSEWMAIASLGVLKAGCAYQPLDPTYPKERLNFMVQDAEAKLLIADEQLRQLVDEYQGEVLLTKEIENLPALTAEANSSLFTLHSLHQTVSYCSIPVDRQVFLKVVN